MREDKTTNTSQNKPSTPPPDHCVDEQSPPGRTVTGAFKIDDRTAIRLTLPMDHASALAQARLELVDSVLKVFSVFGTSTWRSDHLFPVLETELCSSCGSATERPIAAADVAFHVIGPVELSAEERAAVEADVSEKLKPFSWPQYCDTWNNGTRTWGTDADGRYTDATVAPGTALGPYGTPAAPGVNTPSPDFVSIYAGNRFLCRLPVEMLEAAAVNIGPLRDALDRVLSPPRWRHDDTGGN